MQIDFHHATTYVAARLAGFDKPRAGIIAYAAQYVDDATQRGPVFFDNKAVFHRVSSAHKMIDPTNALDFENQRVWMPFHFLPGNGGRPTGEDPRGGNFIDKIVCVADSPLARDMVRRAILEQDTRYALHRLGVTMHVYADTWAHQGFAGVVDRINDIEQAKETGKTNAFGHLTEFLWNRVENTIPPLGHGRANVLPDMPFLSWSYRNGLGEEVIRNNTNDFCAAADAMCQAMQRYLARQPDANVDGIGKKDMATIRKLFSDLTDKDGDARHRGWIDAIGQGLFSFGAEQIDYDEKGRDSWKAKALGTSFDTPVNTYTPEFLKSDWKLFHDAVQAHRFHLAHEILPEYGICAS